MNVDRGTKTISDSRSYLFGDRERTPSFSSGAPRPAAPAHGSDSGSPLAIRRREPIDPGTGN